MFNCEACGKTSKSREKCNIVVTKTRHREYPEQGTWGTEIVKEEKHCGGCAKKG